MNRYGRARAGLWVAAAAMIAAGGCGRESAPAARAEGPKEAKPQEARKLTIAIVPPAMTSTFYIDIGKGARAAAERLGYDLKMPAPQNETDYLGQANMVETLTSQQTAAIAVCAINPKAICAAVSRANEAGIPVFVFNGLEDLPDPDASVLSYVGYNQHKAGQMCGEFILAKLKEKYGEPKGKVILLEGLPGPHNTIRTAGFLEGLGAAAHPAIVVERYPAEWRRDVGRQVLERVLSKDQKVDAVFGCNDGMVQGAALAAQAAGISPVTVGIDGNADTLADVKNGVVTATLAVFPADIGRLTVEAMDRCLKGVPVEGKIETPIRLITKENVKELLGATGG